jgi:aminoglycoside 3'-phosphotransferase II
VRDEPTPRVKLFPALRAVLGDARFETVVAGMSGAEVCRVRGEPERYLKIGRGRQAGVIRDEAARTATLRQLGAPVAAADLFTDGKRSAALLMNALPGAPANFSQLSPEVVVRAAAGALRALHDLPIDNFGFDERVVVRLARAKRDIAGGDVNPQHFEARNKNTAPALLHAKLKATIPPETFVVVHGDATLDNIIIADDEKIGFIDCGRAGLADAYTDLAVMTGDIAERFGPEWVEPFMKAYGAELDPSKAAYFSDLYEFF